MDPDRPVVAVLLAGGAGTRLYPASRADRPKQFCSLGGDRSLLARAADRAAFADRLYAVAPERYADRVREHAPDAAVLVEPEPKDTGPALVYAAHRVREQVGDCVLCCLPTDHHVAGGFARTARRAAAVAARTGGLVAVGVEPTRPATGYGYVEPGEWFDLDGAAPDDGDQRPADGETSDGGGGSTGRAASGGEQSGEEAGDYAAVAGFREKPDAGTAARLLDRGCYWNAGTFAWTPEALLREARDSPLAPLVEALAEGRPEAGFAAVDAVSVDYAVMEGAADAYVVPAAFEWDDLGAWNALARVVDADPDGNVVVGDGLAVDAAGTVLASDDRHVTAVGVEDLVVAAYDDRVLVVPVAEAQRVREAVARLREQGLF